MSPFCTFCLLNGHTNPHPETLDHILNNCPFTKHVVEKMMAPINTNGVSNAVLFSAGYKECPIQKFMNIDIVILVLFLVKTKNAKRNPSFASLKHFLKIYRDDMTVKSKAYRVMKQAANGMLDPSFLHSFL